MTPDQLNTIDVAPERVTKQVISDYALAIVDNILEGHLNAMDVALKFKFMEDLIDKLKEKLRPLVIDELSKYAKGEDIIRYNGQFKQMEAGTKYDFTQCGDREWDELNAQIKTLTEQRKVRESFLKGLGKPMDTFDKHTGETWTIYPPTKTSTSSYSVSWKS